MIKQLFRRKSVDRILQDRQAGFTDAEHSEASLNRTLGVRDLTAFGIAAIIGAGIFSTIGTASANGGPAITMLFVFVAIACGFSALSYAEFASLVPISGSAYTYAYVAFGELIAWIIGWDLLMEYAIGNIAVAISWSDYFTGLLNGLGIHVPLWLTMDFMTARSGFASGDATTEAYQAWVNAPAIGSLRLVCDLPALAIVFFITYLVYVGIRESRTASNIMVGLKLLVVLLVVFVGVFYVTPSNWTPFAPNGVKGVLMGVSAVFFAYIGFDAISTTAEECKNPQRDLPKAMFNSLIICTVLYIAIALVLTGMVPYNTLAVGDPLAYVFNVKHISWLGGVIAVSAVVAMASVLLVFQLGQPRIWMSMSRDGLLPKAFSRIHPKYRTPSFATIVTGFVVAVPALFMNLNEVVALTSIGTLFAFVLVNGGVLIMQNDSKGTDKKFKTPYINSRFIMPLVTVLIFVLAWKFFPYTVDDMLKMRRVKPAESAVTMLAPPELEAFKPTLTKYYPNVAMQNVSTDSVKALVTGLSVDKYENAVHEAFIGSDAVYFTGADGFYHQFTNWLFVLLTLAVTVLAVWKQVSLIPLLGLTSCFYLMTQEGPTNWARFLIWLCVGLVIYFFYSYSHSKLHKAQPNTNEIV